MLLSKSIEEIVDPSLDGDYDWDQLSRMVMVASLCIHQNSTDRPQMSQVHLFFTNLLRGLYRKCSI